MLKKIGSCLFCKTDLKDHTSKKRYCSDNCRVYYNRELKKLNQQKRVEVFYTEPIEIYNQKTKVEKNALSKVDILRNLRNK